MMKEKACTRTYDSCGFRRRAACVCVKDETETDVLLVTGTKRSDRWVVPGGGIEPCEEDPAQAAVREVQEEAGVIGKLGRCLGVFENPDKKTRTSVYVLVVTDTQDEWEDEKTFGRKRKWFTVEGALEQLAIHKPIQMNYIDALRKSKSEASQVS